MNAYEDAGKVNKDAMDNAMKSFSAMTNGFQQIATETTDFTKRSYEQSAQLFQQLVQVRSLDRVIEVQNEYARSAYHNWVSQATRIGEIYADIARETYKPLENTAVKAANSGARIAKQAADETEKQVDKAAQQVEKQTDKVVHETQKAAHQADRQTDKASHDAKADKAAHDAKADKAAHDAKADKAAHDAKADKAAHDAKTDKAAHDAKADKAAHDAKSDKKVA